MPIYKEEQAHILPKNSNIKTKGITSLEKRNSKSKTTSKENDEEKFKSILYQRKVLDFLAEWTQKGEKLVAAKVQTMLNKRT